MEPDVLAILIGCVIVYFLLLFFHFVEPRLRLCERYEKSRRFRILNGVAGTAAFLAAATTAYVAGDKMTVLEWLAFCIFVVVYMVACAISGKHYLPF